MFNSPFLTETGTIAHFAGRFFRERFRPRYECGRLRFYADVYNQDEAVRRQLFGRTLVRL